MAQDSVKESRLGDVLENERELIGGGRGSTVIMGTTGGSCGMDDGAAIWSQR